MGSPLFLSDLLTAHEPLRTELCCICNIILSCLRGRFMESGEEEFEVKMSLAETVNLG
jgi:hypothetical protein